MNDAKIPAASPCPDCRALIPATMDDRTAHRDWHKDLAAKHRGVQKRIAELADIASRAADAAATATREVQNIEIPEQVEPMRLEEWPEDEIDDQDDDDDDEEDDGHLEAAHDSTYADDDANATVQLNPEDLPTPAEQPGYAGFGPVRIG